jgi:hypothetical protein
LIEVAHSLAFVNLFPVQNSVIARFYRVNPIFGVGPGYFIFVASVNKGDFVDIISFNGEK